MGSFEEWVGVIGFFIVLGIWALYAIKTRALQIPILEVLYKQGTMDRIKIIQTLKEMHLYPRYTPQCLVGRACKANRKKGWIVRRGYAAYQISAKGRTELDLTSGQNDWRNGKTKFPT